MRPSAADFREHGVFQSSASSLSVDIDFISAQTVPSLKNTSAILEMVKVNSDTTQYPHCDDDSLEVWSGASEKYASASWADTVQTADEELRCWIKMGIRLQRPCNTRHKQRADVAC